MDTVSQLVSSESREWTGSPTELAEAVNTGMAANALTKYLNVKSGRLLDEYHVKYENRAKHSGRYFLFLGRTWPGRHCLQKKVHFNFPIKKC